MARKRRHEEAGSIQSEEQEATTEVIEEESQEEVSGSQDLPATIVEGTEEEVFFQGREESQVEFVEAENAVEPEVSIPPEANQEEPEQKPVQTKPRINRRPYIPLVENHLERGDLDKKELLALVLERFPEIKKSSASTFLTDALNPRYSHWKDRVVTKTADGKMVFADVIETPLPEGPVQEETTGEEPIE